jgi:HSP20 family protein
MANLPVRKDPDEWRRTPPDAEPLSMPWDPFHQLPSSLTGDEEPRFAPDFHIEETEDGFAFKADLPGIKANEVAITVSGTWLTIRGHIYDAGACSFAGFTRAFTLPEKTDGNQQIRAELDRGVLTVLLSKRREQVRETTGLPCDDPLDRWEWEGGTAREGPTEPAASAVKVA